MHRDHANEDELAAETFGLWGSGDSVLTFRWPWPCRFVAATGDDDDNNIFGRTGEDRNNARHVIRRRRRRPGVRIVVICQG